MTEPDNASGRHERDERGRWRKGVSGNPAGPGTGVVSRRWWKWEGGVISG